MCADTPRGGRHPTIEWRLSSITTAFDPTAAPFRLLLVGRIADDDRNRLATLDLVGVAAGAANGLEDLRESFFFNEGIAESIGDEEPGFRDAHCRL